VNRIRADQRHRQVPVVLVTSRDSREDRERGIQAGADAYIVKGGFDQDRLLETIRRLV
jgi:two-component system chemotaxis sensor kinase CheA